MGFLDLQFLPIVEFIPDLWAGFKLTAFISGVGILLGAIFGLVAAIYRSLAPGWLKWPVEVYVEVIRNTPFLIQLYIIFLGLPAIGIRFSPVEAGILGIVINLGAYSTEIFRAGIDSIHKTQIEAGLALGLSKLEVMRYVVLVPSIAGVWPSLASQFVLMMLGSSVCSFISLEEISGAAYNIQSITFLNFEIYLVIGALYLILAVSLKSLLIFFGARVFPSSANRKKPKSVGLKHGEDASC